jgi:DNA-binding XRE family transcriptional regulator
MPSIVPKSLADCNLRGLTYNKEIMDVPYKIDSALHRTFLKRIKERRKDLDLTQTEVADKLKMTQGAYAQIEAGAFAPGLELIERIGKALKATPAELLSEEPVAVR